MAPWAGRLSSNSITWSSRTHEFPRNYQDFALHGFVLDVPADSVSIDQGTECVSVVTTHVMTNWVGPLIIESSWKIYAESLVTTLRASTNSIESIPVLMGWHPWFRNRLNGGQLLTVQCDDAKLAVREGSLPTGELQVATMGDRPFDDAFQVPGKEVNLMWGDDLVLRVKSSHEWFVLFNELADFTCLEPQNGPPNVFAKPIGCDTYIITRDSPLELKVEWAFD